MTFSSRSIAGSFVFACPPVSDARGQFSMSWDAKVFRDAGIVFRPVSACHSFNAATSTLRGLHYQVSPYGQSKLVCCSRGAVLDVTVDLRGDSTSYLTWDAIELREGDGLSLYIPEGCAHGFLTLEAASMVAYLIEGEYQPESRRVLRWDDPAVRIPWPCMDPILSDMDRHAADYQQ
jgi:dTDP-4-dehydrorhamnose 3,5-epimerase